jgi:hypothetical protein
LIKLNYLGVESYPPRKNSISLKFLDSLPEFLRNFSGLQAQSPTKRAAFSYQTGGFLLPNGRLSPTKRAAFSYQTGGAWAVTPVTDRDSTGSAPMEG